MLASRLAQYRRTLARACIPALCALITAAEPAAAASGACFGSSLQSRPPSIEVYQQAPPPVPGQEAEFDYFPATAFATQSMDRIWQARREPYKLYYFQWANRSTEGVINARGVRIMRKGNFQPGAAGARDQRSAFTSTQKADACTLAQTATALGFGASLAESYARDGGVRLMSLQTPGRAGLADAVDICVLPPRALPTEAAGVLLDYEVQDGRTPDYTLAFLKRFADLVHGAGKQAILLINPFDAPSQIYTGVTAANANAIHKLFDRTTIFIWARNAQGSIPKSLDAQMDILKAGGAVDPKRLIIDFELANTTDDDARAVRRFIETSGLAGVIFWRNYARQGGACNLPVNAKISCVAIGRCTAAPANR